MIDPVFATLVALAGVLLFGAAALHKVRAPGEFVATLAEYRVLPHVLVRPTAMIAIVLEIVLVLGLLWAPTRALAALLGAALLLVYAVAIGANLLRGRREIDCGCTLQHRPIGTWMVVRNVILAALLATATLPIASRSLGWPDVATMVAALLVATLLYASAELLLGRAPSRQGYSMESP